MSTIRDKNGRFTKGSKFWLGKKRDNMLGNQFRKGLRPWNYKGKIKKHCLNCGKEYLIRPYAIKRSKFCSRYCRSSYVHRGNKNSNWKNGITSFWHKIRNSELYKKWRMKVFQRDKFACRLCGYRSKKSKAHGDKESDIHAHHIERNKRLFFKVGNGITLCVPCHRKTYNKEKQFAKVFKEILRDYTPNIRKDNDIVRTCGRPQEVNSKS